MILIAMLVCVAGLCKAAEETPLLAHAPTLSGTQIVFAYGGYLWSVPREGFAPDMEVENDPGSVAAGHDAQLEKAVQVTLEALKKPYPDYHKK